MIYVMSDIHGNFRRFRSIMEQIHLQSEDTLYILGDVIDRHPGGIRILRWIMEQPNVKMLLGNHEFMMLRALERPYDEEDVPGPGDMKLWHMNGGAVTHQSLKHQRLVVREQIIQYLRGLPLSYDLSLNGIDYKLVHGAPPDKYNAAFRSYKSRTHYSVWKRTYAFELKNEDYTLIFGHTPTLDYQPDCPMKIWRGRRKIGIDCGSGYPEDPQEKYLKYGRLACLRLDDMAEFYSDEPWKEKNNE